MALFGSMVYAEIKIKSLSWIQSNQLAQKGIGTQKHSRTEGKVWAGTGKKIVWDYHGMLKSCEASRLLEDSKKWAKLLLYKCKDWRLDPWSVLKHWAGVVSPETLGRCSDPSLSQYLLRSVLEENIRYQHLVSTHLHTCTHTHENKHTHTPPPQKPKS